MGQRVIPVAVTAEYIGGDGVTLGAAGSHNSVVIEYDFRAAGPMWEPPEGGTLIKYVLWTNPQGNTTNRVNLGTDKLVDGYENVYHASPTADAMCVAGWAEMVVVGAVISDGNEVIKVKTEPSRFRVLPGSSRASDNEGVAATVADQLQTEIETVDARKVNKPVTPYDPNGEEGQVLVSLGGGMTKWATPEVADFETVEDVLEHHRDWVTTVGENSIAERHLTEGLRREIVNKSILNVAQFVDELSGDNLQEAIDWALSVSSMVYVPAGEYACKITLEDKRCELYLDAGCVISPKDTKSAIKAVNCEISIYGGTFYEGSEEFGDINSESRLQSSENAIISLQGCYNSVLSGMTVLHSHRAAMISINSCRGVVVENCKLTNMLHCGITIGGSKNHNIKITGCHFENSYVFSYYKDNALYTSGYCYFVSTGGGTPNSSILNTYIPPDQLIYENNYCFNSEDCALDTHGATNVTIRNNTVLETINAITAYNDNRRMYRPKINPATGEIDRENGVQWTMFNILIENNWCESTKVTKTGYNDYPHPYIFLGSANGYSEEYYTTDQSGNRTYPYRDNPGTYDSYRNCIVRGNYFKSPCSQGEIRGLIHIAYMGKNITINNNIIDCVNKTKPATAFVNCIGFEFVNNDVRNAQPTVSVSGSIGTFEGNTGVKWSYLSGTAYIMSFDRTFIYFQASNYQYISGSYLYTCVDARGIRPYLDAIYGGLDGDKRKFNITVTDGVAFRSLPVEARTYNMFSHSLIPELAFQVTVNGTDTICYIIDVIDKNRFVLADGSGNLLPDGTYEDIVMLTATKVKTAIETV